MIKTVVITGPTASGKTALSVDLAKKLGFEIVCADSMQIYRELSVATARPTAEEMSGVPHWLFGEISVCSEYSVSAYSDDATRCIQKIAEKNKRVMLCGGTGLYIDSLINGIDFSVNNSDPLVRARLEAEYRENGAEHMHDKLRKIDPKSADNIHKNNVKRVLRALEIYYVSGVSKTQSDKNAVSKESIYDPLYIGVTYKDRELLYRRIDKRVDEMIKNGLIEEAKRFYELSPCKTALGNIGCKEMLPYLKGESSLDACVQELKTATRRYAKRQLTWLRRNQKINWLYPDESGYDGCFKTAEKLIDQFYGGDYESKA